MPATPKFVLKLSRRSFTSCGLLLLLFTMALFAGCSSSDDDAPDGPDTVIRSTLEGDIRCLDESGMIACKGVPYAAPPVGDLRFAAPADAIVRSETYDATEFCNTCPQEESAFGARSETEDCLFLNIYTPKGDGPYPVMVWIHGGAFISGAGSEAGYDPAALVAKDVILVTLNYRLGALGFLSHGALTDEAGESGNYGLMDQQKALEWVQDNIENFNGDPANVTIFGESAGGHSVLAQLVSPTSDGLFDQAIVESGAFGPGQMPMAYGYVYYGNPFAENAECTSGTPAEIRACLRNLSVADVLAAQPDNWPTPVNGGAGSFLPNSITAAIGSGDIADVPVMTGCNKNEGQLFVLLDMQEGEYYATRAAYDNAVAGNLSGNPLLDAAAIAEYYIDKQGGYVADPALDNRYRIALSEFRTDYMFNANNAVIWDTLSQLTDTYAYWFTDEEAPNSWETPYLPIGATHTLELQYVFGTTGDRGATADQIALSEAMIAYWTNFAKTGDPNGASTTWSLYSDGDFILKLDDPTPTATDIDDFCNTHNCAYWDNPPVVAPE